MAYRLKIGQSVEIKAYKDVYYVGKVGIVKAVIDEGVLVFVEDDGAGVYCTPLFLAHDDYKAVVVKKPKTVGGICRECHQHVDFLYKDIHTCNDCWLGSLTGIGL